MVLVGVGAQDGADVLAPDRRLERIQMGRIVRPGVDHRAPVTEPDDISLGARVGEGRGIGREHAPHQRL